MKMQETPNRVSLHNTLVTGVNWSLFRNIKRTTSIQQEPKICACQQPLLGSLSWFAAQTRKQVLLLHLCPLTWEMDALVSQFPSPMSFLHLSLQFLSLLEILLAKEGTGNIIWLEYKIFLKYLNRSIKSLNLMFKSFLEPFTILLKRRWILGWIFCSTQRNHAVSRSGNKFFRDLFYLFYYFFLGKTALLLSLLLLLLWNMLWYLYPY